MIKEYMNKYKLTNLGVVILLDNSPNLFIVNNEGTKLLEGITLNNSDDNPYNNLANNEIVIVAASILKDGVMINSDLLDFKNLEKYQFNISPLQVTQLKTTGLTINDVFDLDFFELLIIDIIHKYIIEKS